MEESQKKKRKEIQAKITALKKSVTRGDRKKKEFVDQLAQLQIELEAIDINTDDNVDILKSEEIKDAVENQIPTTTTRISKAQKRRDKKAVKESERELQIAEQERENVEGARHIEQQKIKGILKSRKLGVFEIPSNGDCLYAALSHQLESNQIINSVESLRKKTADYIRRNPDLFHPFLCSQDTGEPLTIEQYQKYCDETEKSSTWGGQPEVIQSEGPPILIGEEHQQQPLTLVYHRHMYGLGEHYNSVTALTDSQSEDEFTQ
ncbi:OTU domain-containing protein 6B [Chamberlinius hualienensis]